MQVLLHELWMKSQDLGLAEGNTGRPFSPGSQGLVGNTIVNFYHNTG
jgi:hypothetical protein